MESTALQRLREILGEMGSVLVAYSGGVDSALLLTVAWQELGENAAALTAVSPSLPDGELAETVQYTRRLGVRHFVVPSNEGERPGYRENAGDRCFHCKSELFDIAAIEAGRFGFPWVADGTIVDDFGEHRPGLKAASERGVRHPLAEAGFSKIAVREAAKTLGIPVWSKPSAPCVASRIAVGTQVTPSLLGRVARAEKAIRSAGFQVFRVRVHALGAAELARVEIDLAEWPRIADPSVRATVHAACEKEGFTWITLDLQGYRRGSVAIPPTEILASATEPSLSPPVPAPASSSN